MPHLSRVKARISFTLSFMQRLFFRPAGLLLIAGALLVPFISPGLSGRAWAQKRPRMVAVSNNNIRVETSERVILPYSAVSRIIVEDPEIARAFFQPDGTALVEGLSRGTTTIEVYQSDGTPKLLSIQVGDALAGQKPDFPANPSLPVPTIPVASVPPAPVAAVTPTAIVPALPVLPAPPRIAPPRIAPPRIAQAQTAQTAPAFPITPSQSQLGVTLAAAPVSGTAQAQFTINYSNPGNGAATNAIVRYALDDRVSYVTDSASNGGVYDASRREVAWNLGALAPDAAGQLTLRVEPIEGGRSLTFDSVATIEDNGTGPVTSATLTYSTAVTPLLTVFALPDRLLAGKNVAPLGDVKGTEYQTAVERLSQIGIVQGYPDGLYRPTDATQRAEYAVMTLRGLNLRDLRDITQIKFVLGRASTVNLSVADESGRTVATLTRNTSLEAGEHTVVWNGRNDAGQFVPQGRYFYTCTARDERGEATTLKSTLDIVSPAPLQATGTSSFVDVKATDWYAGYLALGENQGLLRGFPDRTFRPRLPISRVEAAAIVVRALGLSDAAKEWADKNVGFADYEKIPTWANGVVNATTMLTKTSNGKPIMRGTKENTFEPNVALRRDQAALVVQRIIDRETTRSVSVSGAITPGAIVSINSKPVEADAQGRFGFSFDLNTALPTTVAVVDTRNR